MGITVTGKVWKFGPDINTDYISPSITKSMEWDEARKHVLRIHPGFTSGFRPGDVIVAGANFGCGSSRQSAPQSLKRLEVGCVVAESFARIFYRSSMAIAFPLLACPGISDAFEEGDRLEMNFEAAVVKNLTRGTEFTGNPPPDDLIRIVAAGGIMEILKQEAGA